MLNKSKLEAELKSFDTMLKNLQKSKESTDKNIKTTIKQIKDDAIKLKRNLLLLSSVFLAAFALSLINNYYYLCQVFFEKNLYSIKRLKFLKSSLQDVTEILKEMIIDVENYTLDTAFNIFLEKIENFLGIDIKHLLCGIASVRFLFVLIEDKLII